MPANPSKPIFISHAAADKEIADKVTDLLSTAMGIHLESQVFCSSLEGLGIPAGEDFKKFIKSQIKDPEIVILLISQNYLASHFCLAEVGASWVMSHRIIPFLVPPIKYDDMKAVLSGVQALKIEVSSGWNECLEIIKPILGVNPGANLWERKRDQAIEEIKILIQKQATPPHVPIAKFLEVASKLKEANDEIVELEGKIKALNKLTVELKKAKDAEDVARIELDNLPAAEAFESLLERAKDALSGFRGELWDAFYYHFKGEGLPEIRFGYSDSEDRLDQRKSALDNGYFCETAGGEISLNDDEPAVEEALSALDELQVFMSSHPELEEPYKKQNGHQFKFASKQFWKANL